MEQSIKDFIDYYSTFNNEVENKTDDYFNIEETLKELNILKDNISIYDHQLSCINYMLYKTLFKKTNESYYPYIFYENIKKETCLEKDKYFMNKATNYDIEDSLSSHTVFSNSGVLSSEIGSGKTFMTLTTCIFLNKILGMYDTSIERVGNDYIKRANPRYREVINAFDRFCNNNIEGVTDTVFSYIGQQTTLKYELTGFTSQDYNSQTEFIKTPAIVVPHYLINQWVDEIKKFFNINYFVYKSTRTPIDMEELNEVDIILINENSLNDFCRRIGKNIKFKYIFFDEFDLAKKSNFRSTIEANYYWFITTTYKRLCERILSRKSKDRFGPFNDYFNIYDKEREQLRNKYLKCTYTSQFNIEDMFKYYFVVQSNIENIDILTSNNYNVRKHLISYPSVKSLLSTFNIFKYNLLNLDLNKIFYRGQFNVLSKMTKKIIQKLENAGIISEQSSYTTYIINVSKIVESSQHYRQMKGVNHNREPNRNLGFWFHCLLNIYLSYFDKQSERFRERLKLTNLTPTVRKYIEKRLENLALEDNYITCDIINSVNFPEYFNIDCEEQTIYSFFTYQFRYDDDYLHRWFGHIGNINMTTVLNKKIAKLREVLVNIQEENNRIIIFNDNLELEELIEQNILINNSIPYLQISGNNHVVKNKLKKYKDGSIRNILLNSDSYASGLDLHQTTHIIITSKMDKSTERQAIGRGKRLGKERVEDLTVIYVLDDLEDVEM